MLLQLKLSTGGLVPSAGLAAAATAGIDQHGADDELQQLPPPTSCCHTLRTAFEIYSLPHKFPAKLEKEKIASFWRKFFLQVFATNYFLSDFAAKMAKKHFT